MKVAVVTPHHRPRPDWLGHCLVSVRRQTTPCTHFLVNDGGQPLSPALYPSARLLDLPGPHGDAGNAARAAGSVLAVCEGFDAVAYLDADNWYEPAHLESLLAVHARTGAAVCTSGRRLYALDGRPLGVCPEADGDRFADTNCLLLTRPAFPLIAAWYLVPAGRALVADRFLWGRAKALGFSRAHTGLATVGYRTAYRVHYDFFGVAPPAGVKVLVWDPAACRYVTRPG